MTSRKAWPPATRRIARIAGPRERGSASLEAAIVVPAFLLFLGLIIYGGRTATTHQSLASAAADAARSASIARNQTAARSDAQQAATASIAAQDIRCTNITVHVDATDLAKAPGQPGAVKVRVSCRLDLADLSIPGIPGSQVLTATMTSPIDTWRQRA